MAGNGTCAMEGPLEGAPEAAFVTVARFRAPVQPALVDAAGGMRRVPFGRFTVGEIELVSTDKLFSPRNTTTRRRYGLR